MSRWGGGGGGGEGGGLSPKHRADEGGGNTCGLFVCWFVYFAVKVQPTSWRYCPSEERRRWREEGQLVQTKRKRLFSGSPGHIALGPRVSVERHLQKGAGLAGGGPGPNQIAPTPPRGLHCRVLCPLHVLACCSAFLSSCCPLSLCLYDTFTCVFPSVPLPEVGL